MKHLSCQMNNIQPPLLFFYHSKNQFSIARFTDINMLALVGLTDKIFDTKIY